MSEDLEASRRHQTKLRILVADRLDSPLFVRLQRLTQHLPISCEVELDANRTHIHQHIQTHDYDLYLIVHDARWQDGLTLLQEAQQQGCENPMVVLPLDDDGAFARTALNLGAVDCLPQTQLDDRLLTHLVWWVAQRSHLQQKLHQSEKSQALMETAIAYLQTGVFILDPSQPNTPIIFANAAFQQLSGYTAEELYGQPHSLIYGEETDSETIAHLEWAMGAGETTTCTLLNYRKQGEIFWSDLGLYPIYDPSHQLSHFIGLQRDITIHRQARLTLEQLRHQNELILNSAGEGIYGLDLNATITFINPAAARMLGWNVTELIGQSIRRFLSKASQPSTIDDSLFTTDAFSPSQTDTYCRKDGSAFSVEYTRTPIYKNNKMVGTVVVFQDITERRTNEAALRESEERYALAVQGANDGIWDWNLRTGEVYFSPRWKAILGYGDAELPNTLEMWFDCVHANDLDAFKRAINQHISGETKNLEHEHRMRTKTGEYRWVLTRGLAVQDESGQANRLAGSQTDITERKQIEEQLLHDALHDALTGLPNRALLMDRLIHTIEVARRGTDYLYAVLFMDIDRFKVINDSLGHMQGDKLLMAIARRLTTCIRPGDTVARLGGDEFVVLLESIRDSSAALTIAERIQTTLEEPIYLDNHEVFITSSIGLALGGKQYYAAEDLLRDADTAMYRAKAKGRARYEIFDPGMHQQAVALLQLENDLRRAINRQEFFLEYQPIISLRDFRLVGFETLMRWQHTTRGRIPPKDFIPVAEETELIVPLERWAIRHACEQLEQWHATYDIAKSLVVHINLSGQHFDEGLVAEMRSLLADIPIPPEAINLEITETMLMQNAETAVSLLNRLKDLNLRLSIDDFGTGYSSLSYLHRLPIDTLKVDRSFVNKLDTDPEQVAIVRTIMTLAWNLGIEVIAEGVETIKQQAQLNALQCDYAQGFYFSRPLGAEQVETLLKESLAHFTPHPTTSYTATSPSSERKEL
ncbi:MAG: EAL domain-containing protein [Cyanobacteria bacterium J06638_22]